MGAGGVHYDSRAGHGLLRQVHPVPQYTTVRPGELQQILTWSHARQCELAVVGFRGGDSPFLIARIKLHRELIHVARGIVREIDDSRQYSLSMMGFQGQDEIPGLGWRRRTQGTRTSCLPASVATYVEADRISALPAWALGVGSDRNHRDAQQHQEQANYLTRASLSDSTIQQSGVFPPQSASADCSRASDALS
jgi:hypothetical protein